MRGSPLLEREDQLAEAARLVQSLSAGEGGLLLVEGVSGIGKTRLLRATRDLAVEAGATTLSDRGSELERRRSAWSAACWLRRWRRRRLPSARLSWRTPPGASRWLLDIGKPPSAETGAFDLLHSLAWFVVNLAERALLVMLVDDAHWLDSPRLAVGIQLRWHADRPQGREALDRGLRRAGTSASAGRCRRRDDTGAKFSTTPSASLAWSQVAESAIRNTG